MGRTEIQAPAKRGDLTGVWSASASSSLRLTFERLTDGRKLLIAVSHHYGD